MVYILGTFLNVISSNSLQSIQNYTSEGKF